MGEEQVSFDTSGALGGDIQTVGLARDIVADDLLGASPEAGAGLASATYLLRLFDRRSDTELLLDVDGFDFGIAVPNQTNGGFGFGRGAPSEVTILGDFEAVAVELARFSDVSDIEIDLQISRVSGSGSFVDAAYAFDAAILTDLTVGAEQDRLSFAYGAIGERTRVQNPDGSPSTTYEKVYSFLRNDAQTPGLDFDAIDTTTPLPGSGDGGLVYYLQIPGIPGQVTETAYSEWIAVDAAVFGLSREASLVSSGPTGLLRADVLTLNLGETGGAMVELEQLARTGEAIRDMRLVGVQETGDTPLELLAYDLENVTVTDAALSGGSMGSDRAVSFAFQRLEITQTEHNTDGTPRGEEQVSFDTSGALGGDIQTVGLARDIVADDLLGASPEAGAGLASATYLLRLFDRRSDTELLLDVDGFDFGIAVPNQTNGGFGFGRGAPSEVTILGDFEAVAVELARFSDVSDIEIDLQISRVSGSGSFVDAAYAFDAAILTDLTVGAEQDRLSFAYGAIGERTRVQNPDGSPSTTYEKVYSFLRNDAQTPGLDFDAIDTTTPLPGSGDGGLVYYLQIPGIPGQVTETAYSEWIAVDAAVFGLSREASLVSSGPTGLLRADVLTLNLGETGGAMVELEQLARTGEAIRDMRLVGVQETGDTPLELLAYDLENVTVTDAALSGGSMGSDRAVSFAFQRLEITQTEHNTDGTPEDDVLFSFGEAPINGGAGNDLIFAWIGTPETLDGGSGIDTLNTTSFSGNYVVNLATGLTNFAGERFTNFENIVSGSGSDELFGTIGANVMSGGAGNDRILGLAGNDTLNGDAGNDRLNGGDGSDVINGGAGKDTVFAGIGNDTVNGGIDDDILQGDDGNDTLNGDAGNDILRGNVGNDVINGGDGDDRAFGGNDNDTMRGGTGNDDFNGGDGSDFIDGEDGNDLLVGGSGGDTILGGDGNDIMRGEGGNDFLNGENGDDLIFGSSGEDTVFGGAGNDTLEGNAQSDDLFGQSGNDILRGGDGFDFLDGGSGNDILVGGNGKDVLVGGLGVDTLRGNAQADIFDFNSAAESSFGLEDVIDGFEGAGIAGGDRIDVSGIDADETIAGNQAFTFLGAVSSAVGIGFGPGSLWVENAGGQTRLFGNTDFDGVIEFAVKINDGAATVAADYTAGDFLL